MDEEKIARAIAGADIVGPGITIEENWNRRKGLYRKQAAAAAAAYQGAMRDAGLQMASVDDVRAAMEACARVAGVDLAEDE